MQQIATITTKRQLTIPASMFEKIGLQSTRKVSVRAVGNQLIIEPATSLVESLAGSVQVPKKYRGKSADAMIKMAKREYFRKKKP
ncbi:MAG: hypothetical protein ACD_36C00039G0001 [uncultured bacterium]|uniref:SpoVT-AbrB domain-containing protein n=1 Tax=Candidatus Gottesmanbacteria bacterium RIFCSPLOWO2_01_FULL_43_11b TaxID=1798392 RepID=A0A1F6AHC5_9BACT|nr:MAG: hypothetical protein ACD_36C00039G0001 [uncultured bacterium]OGG24149.1 MAG: hypothetical protein A3A79_03080 [Candidatus Gottesmanbacteria bacterium RIFCSPLOWO2_01_FULL_43_11b]